MYAERKKKEPKINGATVDKKTGKKCYCEYGMKKWNNSKTWESCLFVAR